MALRVFTIESYERLIFKLNLTTILKNITGDIRALSNAFFPTQIQYCLPDYSDLKDSKMPLVTSGVAAIAFGISAPFLSCNMVHSVPFEIRNMSSTE